MWHTHRIFSVSDFKKERNTFCDNWYGQFSDYSSAKEACASDTNCAGFVNYRCDGNDFNLCRDPLSRTSSSINSCLYAKSYGK